MESAALCSRLLSRALCVTLRTLWWAALVFYTESLRAGGGEDRFGGALGPAAPLDDAALRGERGEEDLAPARAVLREVHGDLSRRLDRDVVHQRGGDVALAGGDRPARGDGVDDLLLERLHA